MPSPRKTTDAERLANALAHGLCANCGEPAQGNFAIHRDGFDDGPEVDLCDDCGGGPGPSLQEIWDNISTKTDYDEKLTSFVYSPPDHPELESH